VRTYGRMQIFSDELPATEISRRVGIAADRVTVKGEPRRFSGRPENHHAWMIYSPLPGACGLREHLLWLLRKLDGRCDAVASLPTECECMFDLWADLERGEDILEMVLSLDDMRDLVRLKAGIGVSVYVG